MTQIPPSVVAVKFASDTLKMLSQRNLQPTRIARLADGGICISFGSINRRYIGWDFYNNGDAVMSLVEIGKPAITKKLDKEGFDSAIEQIRTFIDDHRAK